MTLFSKLKQSRDQKEKIKQVTYRIVTIVGDVEKLFQEKNVNFYEAMDIIKELQSKLNKQVASLMQKQLETVKYLQSQIKELSKIEPLEDDKPKPTDNP